MKISTLLDVMAEVGALVPRFASRNEDADTRLSALVALVEAARTRRGWMQRAAIKMAAAYAILALHAHDVESSKAFSNGDGR